MFDFISIDWGSVNCGIALANSQTKLILPYKVVPTKNILSMIHLEIKERPNTKKIVVGLPLNFRGQPTQTSESVIKFVEILTKQLLSTSLKIEMVNERGSTKEFVELKNKSLTVDSLSAVKIMEFYFRNESHV